MHTVTHVCKKFFPIKGGIEVVVDTLCRVTRGVVYNRIICSGTNQNVHYEFADVDEVRSYGELFSTPIVPRIFIEIYKALKTSDIVCVHYPFPYADVSVALFGFFSKKKIVVYWHSKIYSQKFLNLALSPLTFLMLARADTIVIATPPMLESSFLLGFFKKKVSVIPYALDAGSMQNIEPTKSSSNDYFLAIGRHVKYKGFEVLIRAMELNQSSLIIVGDGALSDKHQHLIDSLKLNDRVVLLRSVSNIEKEKLLANCRALVLPSIYPSEAFALVQLEAMKYGKPVINTNLESGVPWVARHKKEAITVDVGDVLQLSDAIDKLQHDDKLVAELGEQAVIRVDNEFSLNGFTKKVEDLLKPL